MKAPCGFGDCIAIIYLIWSWHFNCVIWNYRTLNLVFKQLEKAPWNGCLETALFTTRASIKTCFVVWCGKEFSRWWSVIWKQSLSWKPNKWTLQLEMTVFSLLMFGFHFDFDRHEFESLVCTCRRFPACMSYLIMVSRPTSGKSPWTKIWVWFETWIKLTQTN